MSNPIIHISGPDEENKLSLWFICPACSTRDDAPEDTGMTRITVPPWDWNGNLAAPTVEGSVLTVQGKYICHSFIRQGQIEFLSDSTHTLAGTTVDLPELPTWFFGQVEKPIVGDTEAEMKANG